MWTSSSSSATLVSASDLLGFLACAGDSGMRGSFCVRMFEFGCFSVRLEAEIGEFSVSFPPSRAVSSWNYWWFFGCLPSMLCWVPDAGFCSKIGTLGRSSSTEKSIPGVDWNWGISARSSFLVEL